MSVKISVIAAVASLEMVDMSIMRLAFPASYQHDSQKVEFDVFDGGSEIALKGNFAKQSNIVDKDGFKTVTVNPMQVNESITDAGINVNKKRIGENVYGQADGISAAVQSQIENEATGFGKLKMRAQRLLKKSMYDVLVTGKLVVSANGAVSDELDFGLTDKKVNSAAEDWNQTTSDPIKQLEAASVAKGQFSVNTYVLGSEAHQAFLSNSKVLTADNTSTGKKQNFFIPTPAEREAKSTDTFIFVGTTSGANGKAVEIYVELDEFNDGTNDVKYMDKNYAVGFKRENDVNAQIQYGNIPIATGEGSDAVLETFVGVEWIDGVIKSDPVGVKRFYKSSPLPTMNQPKAFNSIKATLVA